MDTGTQNWLAPFIVAVVSAIVLLVREVRFRRKAKREAASDAGKILNQKKALLEEAISKTEDPDSKQALIEQLDEVNAALLGLHTKRLRHALEDAGLPSEETLIANGRRQLPAQQVARLRKIVKEVEALPSFVIPIRDLLLLGNIYSYMEQYEDARKYYDRVLELNPEYPEAWNNHGFLYNRLGKNDEALADYNRALALRPDDPTILANRAVAYHDLKKYKEALADYDRSLQIRPNDAETINNRGATYLCMKKYEEALADFDRSLQLFEHPTTFHNRGVAYTWLGRYNEALADFNRSLKLRPDEADTIYSCSQLFSLWGKTGDALNYLEKAVGKDKKYREMANKCKDFDNIRDDPRFKKLIEPD